MAADPGSEASGLPAPFQLELPGFRGSVDDLLDAVAQHVIEPSGVQVRELTAQMLAQLDRDQPVELSTAGEFVCAAARIMLIKSASLLRAPSLDSEAEETHHLGREALVPVDVVRAAARTLQVREGAESFAAVARAVSVDRVVEPRSSSALQRAWVELHRRRRDAGLRVSAPAFVRLEVALSRLIRGLMSTPHISLTRVLRGASREEVVVHFLAALELVRRREAVALQGRLFDDIALERTDRADELGSRAG